MSSYNPDHIGTGKMLRSDMMQGAMLRVADRIKTHAEVIAPTGRTGDPHRGEYRASFHTRVHDRGGATHDRAEAIVWNDAIDAVYVEWGTHGREPYHIMLRAAVEGGRI